MERDEAFCDLFASSASSVGLKGDALFLSDCVVLSFCQLR